MHCVIEKELMDMFSKSSSYTPSNCFVNFDLLLLASLRPTCVGDILKYFQKIVSCAAGDQMLDHQACPSTRSRVLSKIHAFFMIL